MTTAILCPGPSLANVTQSDVAHYDLRIGVNRAAILLECDVFAALDYPTIRDNRAAIKGNPALMTDDTTYRDTLKFGAFPQLIRFEDVAAMYPEKFVKRTMPAALLLAAYLSATYIDIYGDDKTPEPDFDGYATDETMKFRDAKRWESEKKDCDAICAWLSSRGVPVRHVGIEVIKRHQPRYF